MNKKTTIYIVISSVIFVIIFTIALMVGRYNIKPNAFFKAIFTNDATYYTQRVVIKNLRVPRTLMAALVGIGLSVSGLLYQEIFQNKLVSPDLLGVSSGASVGAALAIVLSLPIFVVGLFSFIFGLIAVVATILIYKFFKNGSSTILLLSGIIVGGFMSSVLAFIKYFANPDTTLASIVYWEMGTFQNALMKEAYIILGVVSVCTAFVLSISWRINIVALGREDAQAKGINYNLYRYLIIIVSTLLTAISVCFCGRISWVGLVVPHISRLIAGRNTQKSIPLCITSGSTFMIFSDILARRFVDSELPISAVTGLFGTIIFLIIFFSKRKYINEH